jgi:RNA polymerase sigma factor (sigma-70 family)
MYHYITTEDVEDIVCNKLDYEAINSWLDLRLNPRARDIVRLRFGYFSPPMSFANIGKIFNISGCRVSQILNKSLRKLRGPCYFKDGTKKWLKLNRHSI